ncbi:HNH endonuclease [Pseudomonas sp. PDM27]|uniref:HNH endonuclease n=1 Tax=Pseudomonas sp. PDM27 TaxID=2854769 RepID=UPI001C451106|nr:HNH endonuclease [Pseudomonas sp. PDM27]MBV7569653.1 HNH endonuclease [Pseudomonas sp. PDM27]
MAVTKGQGNPDWSREEVILALNLYHAFDGKIPGSDDERVCELSKTLRGFPHHSHAARDETFRNPAGVAFKLQNLRSVSTGRGLSNTAKIDREIWAELGTDPIRTHELAEIIRYSTEAVVGLLSDDVEEEFAEGKSATRVHVERERRSKLRKEVIAKRLKLGDLECDVCGEAGGNVEPAIRDSMFECHHIIPLSMIGETKTKVKDMALLCASCHRLLHRAIAKKKQWISIEEAKKQLFI